MSRTRLLLASLAVLAALPARAQDTGTDTQDAEAAVNGFDAHGFNLVAFDADVRDPLTVSRPGRTTQGDFFFGGVFEYAKEPLVFVVADPTTNEATGEEVVALDNLAVLNLSTGYAVLDVLRFDVAAPLYFTSTGPEAVSQGAGVGDIRLSAMLSPLQPEFDYPDVDGVTYKELGFGLGIVPYLDIPVGSDEDHLGAGGIEGGGRLAMTYEFPKATLTGEVGALFGPSIGVDNLTDTDSLTYGAALGYNPLADLGFTLEGHFRSPFSASSRPGTGSPGEALLSLRKSTKSGGHLLAGGAMGVLKGVSSAEYRIFVGGGYGKVQGPAPRDTDLDGLFDPDDACVVDPETKNGYRDEDGCPDGPAKVHVVVRQGGQPFAGASVDLTGPDGRQSFVSTTAPFDADSWPGQGWSAKATSGTCYAGEGQVTIEESGDNMLLINLAPKLDSALEFNITDPSGNPITGANVALASDDAACGPTGGLQQGGGHAAATVGGGTHKYTITAPGFVDGGGQVTIGRGEKRTINVQLEPQRVVITEKAIVINEKVFFEYNKAVIKPESFDLLDEVANTIKTHPELGHIEVGGHTDSDGSDKFNQKLSQQRADAVRKYMIGKGCDATMLLAKGYGESVPLADNATEEGKALNRRVEFILVDKK